MRAGQRNTLIEIYATAETVGASGDVQAGWATTPQFTVWANKRTLTAGEETVAAARQSSEDVVFDVHYLDGITTQHRIKTGGVYYDITSTRADWRGKSLLIYASSGKRYGA